MLYQPSASRYQNMPYRRCGNSGLDLSVLALGLWHNFGHEKPYDMVKDMVLTAFDMGITHFDCADNYGNPPGSAEINFGRILSEELKAYRNQIVITTKAGYPLWPGPYGENGSRKHLLGALDKSLLQLKTDFIDIFYHHRPDPNTPLVETLATFDYMVKSGKVLYIGLSKYSSEQLEIASNWFNKWHTPFIALQTRYSMLDRAIEENGIIENARKNGYGIVAFSPLAQGILTSRYFNEIPEDSRAKSGMRFLQEEDITDKTKALVHKLNEIAQKRRQSLSQMALAWCLRLPEMTSLIIGASRKEQIIENIKALDNLHFDPLELQDIEALLDDYK